MTDDGLEPVEVTGRWVGFYRHRWEQLGTYPIVADIKQTGNKIAGEMYDQITERSDYLDSLLEVCGDEVAIEVKHSLTTMIRQFGTETVIESRLPDTSDIRGKITGNHVRFTKSYRGATEFTWTVQEQTVATSRRDGHKVQYSGHLDRDRMCITGSWVIKKSGLLGWISPPEGWGSFELYRKS